MPRVQSIDDNGRTINSNSALKLLQPWTFVTATTGATGAHTLFTVTGDCLVQVFGICNTDLLGAATLEVGVVGNTAGLLAQIADTTTLDDGEIYVDATPGVGVEALPATFALNDGADIIMTIGATAITGGQVDFYCLWRPLSSSSEIVVTIPA